MHVTIQRCWPIYVALLVQLHRAFMIRCSYVKLQLRLIVEALQQHGDLQLNEE